MSFLCKHFFFQQTGPEDYGRAATVQRGYLLEGFSKYKQEKRLMRLCLYTKCLKIISEIG